jgi:crotonobetainyl-CoA:carnitine CoA-transferase CaiB-like acyl-CoA transferase
VLALPLEADADTVGAAIAAKTAVEWQAAFAGKDACVALVASLEEALADPHFMERELFAWKVRLGARTIPALPVPIERGFRGPREPV